MWKEIQKLFHNIKSTAFTLIVLTIIFFSFGVAKTDIVEVSVWVPVFTTTDSIAAAVFEHIRTTLVPTGVDLIVTNPLAAFIAQMKVAVLLALLVVFPLFVYRIGTYLAPALFTREQKMLRSIFFPTVFLFFAGAAFSYLVIIPPTFRFLYKYTESLGALPFFSVGEFIALVFAFVFTVGLMFLLPVGMVLARKIGLVDSGFWKRYWRYAFFSFLVLSAILTPDGSGISMLLLSAPLAGLYGIGVVISSK